MDCQTLRLSDHALIIKFIRSQVGSEKDLYSDLASNNPGSIFFKILGRFDILMVSRATSFDDALRLYSDSRILEMNTFQCMSLDVNVDTFLDPLKSASSPSLTLLKLQEPVFVRKGFRGIETVINFFSDEVKGEFAFIGFGYYEILLFKIADSFESTFTYVEKIRNLAIKEVISNFSKKDGKKALLTSTVTLPLISYDNVIVPNKWDKLKGSVSPLITLKCAPGHERYLSEQWNGSWNNVFGAEDLMCQFKEPVPLSKFVEDLIKFRKNASESLMFFNTATTLHQNRQSGSGTKLELEFERPKYRIFERLKQLERIDASKTFLISELVNVVHLINTYIGSRALTFSFANLLSSLKYLNWLLIKYEDALKKRKRAEAAELEDDLLCYAESVRTAISQHFPHEDQGVVISLGNRQSFDCSLSVIIKAISVIPEQLLAAIGKSPPPPKLANYNTQETDAVLHESYKAFGMPWKGFVLISLSENYLIIDQSERISVPFRDIFNVLNWITLSHEISHAYNVRIFFDRLEKEYLDTLAEVVNQKKPELLSEFLDKKHDSHYEMFAHWFDYRHFFSGNYEFYLWSIWRTWIEIPRPYQFPEEYWLRSLFVKICDNWSSAKHIFESIYQSGLENAARRDAYKSFFREKFDEVESFVKLKFPDHFLDLKLEEEQKNEVSEDMLNFMDLCRKLEEEYVVSELIYEFDDKSLPQIEDDVRTICEGRVIKGKVKNPFLLLKCILKKVYSENFTLGKMQTLALIFSLWQASREYKRPLR